MPGLVDWGAFMAASEDRWIGPTSSSEFLEWVEGHPTEGLVALFWGFAVVTMLMIPIGTPLTLGCGYIYKAAYGWRIGLAIATAVSVGGCALGSVLCFWLGRFLMRDQVRTWIRKYPLFDAIDIAAGEQGFRIMAMLYLTPILPLGPVSYMCGTTSMTLSSFFFAKITSLPPMLLYCFIGASADALIEGDPDADEEGVKPIHENQAFVVSGIALSLVMLTAITHFIKRELNRILERQKKNKLDQLLQEDVDDMDSSESSLELGLIKRRVS